jgi:hypothetical protein
MRISVESVAATGDLAGYLERCGCIVSRTGPRMIEVSPPPRSLGSEHAQLELEAYVQVWRELNPAVVLTTEPNVVRHLPVSEQLSD